MTLKVRVGDLVRNTACQWHRVKVVGDDGMVTYDVPYRSFDMISDIVEVVRPAKRRTLTRKQAREWLRKQERWVEQRTEAGWKVWCGNHNWVPAKTYTAAVIALRASLGVKS